MASKKPEQVLTEYYLLRLLQWRDAVERLDATAVATIDAELKKLRRTLGRDMAEGAEKIAASGMTEGARRRALERLVDDAVAPAVAAVAETITVPTLMVAPAAASMAYDMLSVGGRAGAFVPAEVTDTILKEWFTQSPLLGQMPLNGWVEKTFANGVKGEIFRTLDDANVAGEGYGAAIKRLMDTAVDKGAAITQRQASTLARTYIQTANNGAMQEVYAANADLIPYLRWTTAGDNHTCPLCAVLDGRIYRQGAARPAWPRHECCRCMLVGLTESAAAMGLSEEDIASVRRWNVREAGDLTTKYRRVLDTVEMKGTYADWWATLPVAQQDSILGPVRAGLIREKAIVWGDLVDFKTGRYYTLEEIGFNRTGRSIFQDAKNGKIHAGFYDNYTKRTDRELGKSISSISKIVAEHEGYIKNPLIKDRHFESKSDAEKRGAVEKWERDIRRQREHIAILKGIIDERKQ